MAALGLKLEYQKYIKVDTSTLPYEVILMRKGSKNLLGLAGIISVIVGVVGAIPSVLQARYGVATGSALLIIIGLILLAFAFEE